jgi:DNA-binding FadR family transcriptional regulator
MVQVTINAEVGDLEKVVQSDTDFHEQIYRASRNNRLVQIINNLRDQIQRFRSASLAHPGRIKETLEEHKILLEAISERDIVTARRLAQEHIENAESSMMEALRGHPELLDDLPKGFDQ